MRFLSKNSKYYLAKKRYREKLSKLNVLCNTAIKNESKQYVLRAYLHFKALQCILNKKPQQKGLKMKIIGFL